jgi:maleamate amidohydrolase
MKEVYWRMSDERRYDIDYLMRWRDFVPREELEAVSKAGMGRNMGFGGKPAVLVVDMTYLYVDPAFPLAAGKGMWHVVDAVSLLLQEARPKEIPVFYTRRNKRTLPVEKGLHAHKLASFSSPLLNDPKADEWPPAIAPLPGDVIIQKPKYSPFFETPLRSMLTYDGVDTLIVTGISTSACVRCAVVDAFQCNIRPIVPEECVGDRSLSAHRANLFDIQMKFGDVLGLQEILAWIRSL